METLIKLGVIGMSEGNGHPYSWSAIFNGYNADFMKECPFPVIPDYLSQQNFPEDGLGSHAKVTHIWTQDRPTSEHIANASKIPIVVNNIRDMIGQVDAVLLARDDAENHLEMAKEIIKSGTPIFIDKPFALNMKVANKMLSLRTFDSQIFTCSSLRFAEELKLSKLDKKNIGKMLYVEGSIGKYWDTYAIHLLEPIIAQLPNRGNLIEVKSIAQGEIKQTLIQWENLTAYIKNTGTIESPLSLTFFGEKGNVTKQFTDSFSCFRSSLFQFIKQIRSKENIINTKESLELVKILEWGNR